MSIQRVLEDEVMDTLSAAQDYDAMDHAGVNRAFADDLLAFAASVDKPIGDVLDIGTGTALIPLILCELDPDSRIIGTDMAVSMLDLAVYNIAASEVTDINSRLQLAQRDAKSLDYTDSMFDTVMSNTIIHHLPEPAVGLGEAVRVCKADGLIFIRDLLRPDSESAVENLVATHAANEQKSQRKLFEDSLRAALTLEEIRDMVQQLGFAPETVAQSSDRHWTWSAVKP